MLPYTAETLFALFDEYNRAIRPLPGLAIFLTAGVLMLVIRSSQDRSRVVLGILAAGWLWTGIAYQMFFHAEINFAAPVYGAAFILQSILLAWTGVFRQRTVLHFDRSVTGWAGIRIAIISAIILPVIDWQSGVGWTDVRLALIAPGATAGFTLGILMMSKGQIPIHLVVIPILWAAVAGIHAWILGIPQDYLLPVVGIIALIAAIRSRSRRARVP